MKKIHVTGNATLVLDDTRVCLSQWVGVTYSCAIHKPKALGIGKNVALETSIESNDRDARTYRSSPPPG